MATVSRGDSLWAFTRRGRDGLCVLAAELVVKALTHNPRNYRYGIYRIWGDPDSSRYFDVDIGPSTEPLIRYMSIRARGSLLGQAFQGHAAVRVITPADQLLVASFARDLPVLERVGIYPEDEFEARLIQGESIRPRVVREERAEYSRRLEYLYETVDVHRARRNVEELHELYSGRCQLCLFDPCDQYGFRLCHGHHIQWLSRGGDDDLANMVLLCPNHHSAIHRDDAAFDYASLSFSFSAPRIEAVRLNRHLPDATA